MPHKTVVRCYFKTFGDFVTTYASDLSKGGLFVSSHEHVGEGDPLRLEFKLRNDYPLIMGEGEVVSVQAGGFVVNFTQLDADSEKFLNEVVRVKAAELKPDPSQPKPPFDVQIAVEAADELDDAFDSISEIEEIEEVEPVEVADAVSAADDPFADGLLEEPAAAQPEADFADMQLEGDAQGAEEIDDPFGDPMDDAATTSGYEPVEAAEPPATGFDDDFEPVEQAPANPQALFDDIQAEEQPADVDEATVGGSTTVFERVSALKERRALLVGAAVGVVVLVLGAGAFFYLNTQDGEMTQAAPAPITPAAVAQLAPPPAPVTAAAAATGAAAVDATATVAAPAGEPAKPVAPAPQPQAQPVAAVQPATKQPAPAAEARKRQAATGPAKQVTAVEAFGDRVEILGDGNFGRVKYFSMNEPNRVVVDVYAVGKGFKGLNRPGKGAVARIRPGVHDAKLRFVLDLANERGRIPKYSVDTESDRIVIRFQ